MSETPREIEALRREVGRLRRVAEASYALYTTFDLTELLERILEAAKGGVDADRGTVFLLSDDGTELWSRVLTGDGDLEIRLPVGQGIAGSVAATGRTIRIEDARSDPRFDPSWDERSGYDTRKILSAPIRRRDGKVMGVFQLLNKRSGSFDDDDEAFLDALSGNVSLALESARLHGSELEKERQDREIRLAQNVQRAYQPERRALQAGVLSAAALNVLCEDASGDYYDFIDMPDGRLAAVIGDVSGHGLGAALVMAQARALLRAFACTVDGLPRCVDLLNDFLSRDMTGGRFMSLFIAVADPTTGVVEWQCAGHPPAFVHRAATGAVEQLAATGRVLGVLEGVGYRATKPVQLEPGDVLLLYTDGATEARNPTSTFLDEEGLADRLGGMAERAPADLLDGLLEALIAWTGEKTFGDDLTLVALKRTGPS